MPKYPKAAVILSLLLLAGMLALSGCGTVADQDWTPAPSTESDWIFDTAAPELVTYPLADTAELSMLMADTGAGELLAASTDYTGIRLSVEFVSLGELNERLEAMLAAQDLPDLLEPYDETMSFTVRPGLAAAVLDLTDYVMTCAPNYLAAMGQNEILKDHLLDDGEINTFYQLSTGSAPTDYGPWIRQDWLEEQGWEVPTNTRTMRRRWWPFGTPTAAPTPCCCPATGPSRATIWLRALGRRPGSSAETIPTWAFMCRTGW